MNYQPAIDAILQSACPSLQYRLRKEILGQSSTQVEMIALQKRILHDQSVQAVIADQGADGWLAWAFHGYDSMESGIRILCEKGVETEQPVLARALEALALYPERLVRGIGKVGKIIDDMGMGGSEAIRAHLFAQAGIEDTPLVQSQVGEALTAFDAVRTVHTLDEICEPYQEKLVFRAGVRWPSIYHLRLLAMTQGWRSLENHLMMVESIQRMVSLSPIPAIHVKYKSQLIAPASFCMDDFTPNMDALTDAGWMQWFHRMELVSRLGVVREVPALHQQVRALETMLQAGGGLFTKILRHGSFHKWGAYTGLALENDWRLPKRRIIDLTFRSLLILHYSKL